MGEPETVTLSTGQVAYRYCFWCSRELVPGDWLWGCSRCAAYNVECAGHFRRGQGLALVGLEQLFAEWSGLTHG
jgi:hypothetical protein